MTAAALGLRDLVYDSSNNLSNSLPLNGLITLFLLLFKNRTQSRSVDDAAEEQDPSPAELSLHPDVLTPELLQCTPANLVEAHRGSQTGEQGVSLCPLALC